MEAGAFERVYQAFQEFHTYFAGAFGRKQWREQSQYYLQGLLVQSQERRNAENLSEMVPVSARSMQRFLTEARWDDDAVIARLQEYLGPKLEHPLAVWVFDGSDFPKQGVKSRGGGPAVLRGVGKDSQLPGRSVSGPCGAPWAGSGGQTPVSTQGMEFRCLPLRGCGRAGGPAELPGEDGPGPGDAGAGSGTGLP